MPNWAVLCKPYYESMCPDKIDTLVVFLYCLVETSVYIVSDVDLRH